MLYRILLPYACYGIIVEEEKVIGYPTIAKWMKGKHINFVKYWVDKKGGNISLIQ